MRARARVLWSENVDMQTLFVVDRSTCHPHPGPLPDTRHCLPAISRRANPTTAQLAQLAQRTWHGCPWARRPQGPGGGGTGGNGLPLGLGTRPPRCPAAPLPRCPAAPLPPCRARRARRRLPSGSTIHEAIHETSGGGGGERRWARVPVSRRGGDEPCRGWHGSTACVPCVPGMPSMPSCGGWSSEEPALRLS